MNWKWAVLGFVAVALCACAGIPPEHAAAVLETINEAERSGAMTAQQAETLRALLAQAAEGVTWGEVAAWAGGVGLAALTSLTGVRVTRGPAKPMKGDDAAALRAMVSGLSASDVANLRKLVRERPKAKSTTAD